MQSFQGCGARLKPSNIEFGWHNHGHQASNKLYLGVSIASTFKGTIPNPGKMWKPAADCQGPVKCLERIIINAGQLWHQAINQLYPGVGIVSLLEGKGLFPDKTDDSDDEFIFGDDDFPQADGEASYSLQHMG